MDSDQMINAMALLGRCLAREFENRGRKFDEALRKASHEKEQGNEPIHGDYRRPIPR